MRVVHSAQFEISVDGTPRTYRDRKDLAMLAGGGPTHLRWFWTRRTR
jgi:hypothetical protein